MNRRMFNGLLLAFVLGCYIYSVRQHGWGATIKGLAIFWGVFFGTVLLLRLNEKVAEWRESRQEVQP